MLRGASFAFPGTMLEESSLEAELPMTRLGMYAVEFAFVVLIQTITLAGIGIARLPVGHPRFDVGPNREVTL